MTLDTFSPLMEKQMQPESTALSFGDRIRLAKDFAWPVSLLLFAGIAFMALCRVLKHRQEFLSQQLAAKAAPEKEGVPTQEKERNEDGEGTMSNLISNLLHQRADDIQWLIEDAALRSDLGPIQKIVTLFPAQELTSRFQLSNKALSSLARAAQLPQNGKDKKAITEWLSSTLDQAHWIRVEEQSNRLGQIRRYPPEKAKKVFSRLSSTSMKAVFITALPEERWPELLETLESEERVQLGLTIADYTQATSEIRSILSSQLTEELIQVDDDLKTQFEKALESLALYLSEKENQKLWKELSIRNSGKQPLGRVNPISIDLIFSELDPAAAAEICTRLDVNTLSIILSQVSEEVRMKIHQTLPKTLQSRLRSTEEKVPSEAAQMKARAALLETYRQFVNGGMIQ